MKKKLAMFCILTCLASSVSLTGTIHAYPNQTSQNHAVFSEPMTRTGTRWTLSHFLMLLGKEDQEAGAFFGGGTLHYSPDGSLMIGRTYPVRLFGENLRAGTLYDEAGRVQNITVQLQNPNAAVYEPVLRWYYGTPTKMQKTPSEAGATYTEWTHDNASIRLYQMYGLSALEVTPDRPDRHATVPSHMGETWIPEQIRHVSSGMKKFPPLERAIVKTYGISEEEREKTRYAYEILDLDGNGEPDVLAIVSGPYTSGTGGDSALWGTYKNGTFTVKQTFTLMRTPLIVTSNPAGIILRRSGGGMPANVVRLALKDGKFVETGEEDVMKTLDMNHAVVLFEEARPMRL
jgi:hypothetical protein